MQRQPGGEAVDTPQSPTYSWPAPTIERSESAHARDIEPRRKMAKIRHIAISTQNPEETAKFYQDVFDLKSVGKIEGENAEGYYLSDGSLNLAILKFKSDEVAGDLGMFHNGLHHIGFQVEDLDATDARLRRASSAPMEETNSAFKRNMRNGRGGRNVEMKYSGPDGVMIDVSRDGWVGTET